MLQLNANIAVVVLGVIYGVSAYLRGRTAASHGGISVLVIHVGAAVVWYFALNALRLSWLSLAGFGVGIVVAVIMLAIVFSWTALSERRRRRDWR